MTLGERLRQIRKEKDITKQELSAALNVPRERIRLYEIAYINLIYLSLR